MAAEPHVFRWALGISAVAHLVVGGVAVLPLLQSPADKVVRKPLNVTYLKVPPAPEFSTKDMPSTSNREAPPLPRSSARVARVPRLRDTTSAAIGSLPVPAEPVKALRPDVLEAEQEAPVAPVDLGVISATSPLLTKEPAFQLYYRTIRTSIRAKAYEAVPKAVDRGDVYLSFIVNRRGGLESLTLDERRSAPNRVLRQAALRAVRRAAPFPPFPPVVAQSQIAFTIAISFE